MEALKILGIIISIIFGLILVISFIRENRRKRIVKTWKVGDKLILIRGDYYNLLQKTNKQYAVLEGWSLTNLYINCGDNVTRKVDWVLLKFNKSALWREDYNEAKKIMGVEPGFTPNVLDNTLVNKKIDGNPIELMSEIECQVYLKQAIESEDYDTAELIRKRLEKFR